MLFNSVAFSQLNFSQWVMQRRAQQLLINAHRLSIVTYSFSIFCFNISDLILGPLMTQLSQYIQPVLQKQSIDEHLDITISMFAWFKRPGDFSGSARSLAIVSGASGNSLPSPRDMSLRRCLLNLQLYHWVLITET
ncbi:hypothetical protein FOCG_04329 [Fusarium oxysporum f. sp. radicis-lycopersici 26381]|jgi:hypothetical protein|uniref:Uncharacterized protein n=3 Tax=Fusarium oxysporum TaxID=5507 RepID=X0NJ78_FUSOX|nr:hypothetical protein FOWG_07759 [Fusarium oxysporum f. sp. lycopersici MN25]EXL56891.1 hypothetical protein FOCG_04329 [Fusarium oxysporum f. sp. radicis-lycopersici 26381]EXL81940.1 hypothetical protein FOPG_04930 [Fusarium oxysporum f. sp. conglutinans race 2 54008]EXM32655.1 hypothetical protein FOTG_02926 [Fusarium oxysporum f. sp. vasinfectum 25433]KAI8403356.1 hypothetical protein FOFC_16793 [Fusarium oxysporum]